MAKVWVRSEVVLKLFLGLGLSLRVLFSFRVLLDFRLGLY